MASSIDSERAVSLIADPRGDVRRRGVVGPNPRVRAVYERLGELLERGDDVFVDEGPTLLRDAAGDPAFFEGVESTHAEPGTYTRKKVVGDPGRHVIRFMEWPPGFALLPHEHHGRPCFELLVEGQLCVVTMRAHAVGDDRYDLEVLDVGITRPGETAVVDPRVTDVHAVYSPVRSRSLHVYPEDNRYGYAYVLDRAAHGDIYTRERFPLRDD